MCGGFDSGTDSASLSHYSLRPEGEQRDPWSGCSHHTHQHTVPNTSSLCITVAVAGWREKAGCSVHASSSSAEHIPHIIFALRGGREGAGT